MPPKTITKTTWLAFSAALAATMMDLIDATIASTAGPALQQLGMSLGVAGLGTLFFGLLGSHVDRAADFLAASEPTILVTVALLAAAFAIGFLLPRHARPHQAPAVA